MSGGSMIGMMSSKRHPKIRIQTTLPRRLPLPTMTLLRPHHLQVMTALEATRIVTEIRPRWRRPRTVGLWHVTTDWLLVSGLSFRISITTPSQQPPNHNLRRRHYNHCGYLVRYAEARARGESERQIAPTIRLPPPPSEMCPALDLLLDNWQEPEPLPTLAARPREDEDNESDLNQQPRPAGRPRQGDAHANI
ncbi:hypothetical protein ASPCAL05631 [Aspergillus calidoustus]|uniref:Uncharacterized protein n=1 Tax=Aspergillus calidoustus TaxID=454130 RepID=A0A0U5FYS2_ASPCI|nr:hypothetical protein ASPCAL05631 [Aspergillus calidoustus]